MPRCPKCVDDVSLEELWRVSPTNRSNFLISKTGIKCPHCGARLRILQQRASWGVHLLLVFALILVGELADRLAIAGVLPEEGAFFGVFVFLVILSWPVWSTR